MLRSGGFMGKEGKVTTGGYSEVDSKCESCILVPPVLVTVM